MPRTRRDDLLKLPSNADGTEFYAVDEDTARLYAEQENVDFELRAKDGKLAKVEKVGTAWVIRPGKTSDEDTVSTAHRRAASNADADADFQPQSFTAGPTVQNLDPESAADANATTSKSAPAEKAGSSRENAAAAKPSRK